MFSYEEYKSVVKAFASRATLYNADMPKSFALIRHDVEFSVDRAHKIALIDRSIGLRSTFFFQVRSAAYNPFSIPDAGKITDISRMGCEVGLHFYVSHIKENDWPHLEEDLDSQRKLFESGLDMKCRVFSFHRPPRWVLENRADKIGGVINAYGESFFEFSESPTEIKYIADSKHKWSYGYPLDFVARKKVQILLHPDEWSESGDSDNKKFFDDLREERARGFVEILKNETNHFAEVESAL